MKIENMDKDKLITFLTSEDEELRNIGLEIIKNNFELNFDFYKGIDLSFVISYSLTADNFEYTVIAKKKNIYEVLESEVHYFSIWKNSKSRIKELVNIIIEYNNGHRQNKGNATI